MKKSRRLDSVSTMRKIRDRLGKQIEGMTFEEEKRFIQERLGTGAKQPSKARRHRVSA